MKIVIVEKHICQEIDFLAKNPLSIIWQLTMLIVGYVLVWRLEDCLVHAHLPAIPCVLRDEKKSSLKCKSSPKSSRETNGIRLLSKKHLASRFFSVRDDFGKCRKTHSNSVGNTRRKC